MTVGTEEFSRQAGSGVSQSNSRLIFLRWRCGSKQDFIRFLSSLLERTAAVLTIARFLIQNPLISIRPGGGVQMAQKADYQQKKFLGV